MTRTRVLDIEETPAYIAARALLDARQERGTFRNIHIDSVHDTIRDIHSRLDPQDIDRPLSQTIIRYIDGKASLAFRDLDADGNARLGTPMNFTKHGLGQLAKRVLGAGGGKFIGALRNTGESGRKLSEVNWNYMAARQDAPSLLRTVQLPGQTFRTTRAVLSGGGRGYSVVDNVHIIEMLNESPEFRDLPVIEAKITLNKLRIKMLLDPADAALFDPKTGRLLNPTNSHDTTLDLVVPTVDIWNDEVGTGSAAVEASMYRFACLNGMLVSTGGGGGGMRYRWNHVGGPDRAERIRSGFEDALKSVRVLATGAVNEYKETTNVAIDDAFATLDAWAGGDLTGKQIDRVRESFDDETTGPRNRFSSLVDAITLAAQSEGDLDRRAQMERFAHRMMQKGLAVSRKNDRRIAAPMAA